MAERHPRGPGRRCGTRLGRSSRRCGCAAEDRRHRGQQYRGLGVGPQKAFPAQLEALLRARGYDAQIINAGVSGSTTSGMLGRIDAAVPAGTSLVILQPGVNDDLFFGAKEARAKNIASMVNRMRARHIKVIVFENRIVSLADRQPDGLHFSEKGHALAAAWLVRQVLGSAAPGGDSRSSRHSIARHSCDPATPLIG